MDSPVQHREDVLGRGVYSGTEAVQLINFRRQNEPSRGSISRRTLVRWLRGYEHRDTSGVLVRVEPIWHPDYADDDLVEVSFRELIELRFVRAFRDAGLGLQTIRACFKRAVEEVNDARPFSTRRFRTDGKTIFLEITHDIQEGELIELRRRQSVFHRLVAPSLRDLEFDAEVVARWFPLGITRKSIVVDPARAFGRPVVNDGSVPVEIISEAVELEGSPEKVAKLYDVPLPAVREAVAFQKQLAA